MSGTHDRSIQVEVDAGGLAVRSRVPLDDLPYFFDCVYGRVCGRKPCAPEGPGGDGAGDGPPSMEGEEQATDACGDGPPNAAGGPGGREAPRVRCPFCGGAHLAEQVTWYGYACRDCDRTFVGEEAWRPPWHGTGIGQRATAGGAPLVRTGQGTSRVDLTPEDL